VPDEPQLLRISRLWMEQQRWQDATIAAKELEARLVQVALTEA
jgi:hypothetical protein